MRLAARAEELAMITILGAGGAIANDLVKLLAANGEPIRLVGRNPKPLPGTTIFAADLADREQTIRAVEGSSVVHLLAGLKYSVAVWQDLWPRIIANTIEACKRAQAPLIFFDNVYMYGKVAGPMTETTPYAPCSRKGEIRARVATSLMDAVKAGGLQAIIARAADFYGPGAAHSLAHALVFDPLAKGSKPSCLVAADLPHSFTFTPDAARGLAMLAGRESAWNQTWHLPTSPNPPTSREFIATAATEFGKPAKFRVLNKPLLRMAGWFNSDIGELYEMLYQNDSPYLFDSRKFAVEFGFAGTPYAEGIHLAAESYRSGGGNSL